MSFWGFLEEDLVAFVTRFFDVEGIHKGSNASFFRVIPKFQDPKSIKNLPPISFIECQYKIIGKIIANRSKRIWLCVAN